MGTFTDDFTSDFVGVGDEVPDTSGDWTIQTATNISWSTESADTDSWTIQNPSAI